MPSVFFSYSHADEALRDQLEKQLSMLKRQGVIETWHDRRIGAGQEFAKTIDDNLDKADIILLLVSPDFLASDYCYDIEMTRAMERHHAGEATVVPVILRACDWQGAPFGKLNATPRDGKPIRQWPDIDEAFLQVAKAIKAAAQPAKPAGSAASARSADSKADFAPAVKIPGPRSSNLRLAKTFTQRDKDQFQLEAFEFMARFFENSLTELADRNAGIETSFRRVDANRFFATIYRDGSDIARATVFIGGSSFDRGINYVHGETMANNSYNETLNVEADDHSLYLKSLGIAALGSGREQKLSPEGAAELYWGMIISPLQQRR